MTLPAIGAALRTCAFIALTLIGVSSWAQCGVTMSCPGTPKVCDAKLCFADAAAKARYETENDCKFPPGPLCGAKEYDKVTQCCGKDAKTGTAAVQTRVATKNDPKFDWGNYQKSCPDRTQSSAPPNALWAQCVVGQRHSAADDYPIVLVEANGGSRSYCVDGCSTPPGVVTSLFNAEIFLVNNKDNPSGFPSASFFNACATHDRCYQSCGGGTRRSCDDQLLANSLTACATIPVNHLTSVTTLGVTHDRNTRDACVSAANKMNTGLNLGGEPAFNLRRQQYCQCC